MEQDIVLTVTLNHEADIQNPGLFTFFTEIATKFIPNFFKKHQPAAAAAAESAAASAAVAVEVEEERIPKSSQHSSAATPSPDPAITLPSQLPNNVPASSAERRNPAGVQNMWSHPIFLKIQEQELGKFALSLVGPTTIALLTTNSGKSQTVLVHFVLTGLSMGCIAIWHGIALRGTVPRTAIIIELVGIVMVFISFNSLVASALPIELAWVPMLCGCSCVLPFVIAVVPVEENTAGGD